MIGLWGEGGYVMKKRAYRYLCGAAVLILVLLVIRTMNTPGTVPEDYIAPVYASVWSLLPPVIAIVLALITKEVYSSLFIGVLVGALLYANGNLELALNTLMFHPDGGFVVNLTDLSHASILVFVTILGGLVVLMNKSGGAQAFGDWASRRIKSRVGAQLATILMGLLIFVDDGFNCMTVGSVMRPITDGHNVSRAKLAYILDSTAAPVCIIAPISCWAAAVSYAVPESMNINGFNMFIRTIPYNMYALTTLLMMVLLAVFELDYGPMKLHEYNAVKKGDLFTTGDRPYSESQYEAKAARSKVSNLVIPVVLLIVTSIIGMIYTGGFFQGASLIDMDLDGFMGCLPAGFRSMCAPMIILILSWNLSGMTGLLGAGNYVHDVINASASSFQMFLPAIVFLVSVFLAFSTGTSWGTFSILIPIVCTVFPQAEAGEMLVISISACLAGAVCGDHCSPISDTTIMSSAGAACNHINHVNTQLPYAITSAAVSAVGFLVAGILGYTIKGPAAMIATPVTLVLMILVILVIRKSGAADISKMKA